MKKPRIKKSEQKKLLFLFLMGILWDGIITLDVVFTARLMIPWAMVTTFAITVISATAYGAVIGDQGGKILRVLTLASGSAVGAGLVLMMF